MNNRGANRSLQFTWVTRIPICCLGFLQSLPALATDFNCLSPKSPTAAALRRQGPSPRDLWIPAALAVKEERFLLHPNRIFTALFLLQASINTNVNQGFSLFHALLAAGRRESIFPLLFTNGEQLLSPPYNQSVADLLQISTDVLNFTGTPCRPQKPPFQSLQDLSQRMEQANPSPRHWPAFLPPPAACKLNSPWGIPQGKPELQGNFIFRKFP